MSNNPRDPTEELRAVTERNGIMVTDDDLRSVLGAITATTDAISRLAADLSSAEEPAGIFSSPAGGPLS